MAKKITITMTMTEKDMKILFNILDIFRAQLGGGEDDEYLAEDMERIDKMIQLNGYARDFK
jgi:hypothetical protein